MLPWSAAELVLQHLAEQQKTLAQPVLPGLGEKKGRLLQSLQLAVDAQMSCQPRTLQC